MENASGKNRPDLAALATLMVAVLGIIIALYGID
jgi:hypothetical protein